MGCIYHDIYFIFFDIELVGAHLCIVSEPLNARALIPYHVQECSWCMVGFIAYLEVGGLLASYLPI